MLPNLMTSDLMTLQWSRRVRAKLEDASVAQDVVVPNTLFVLKNGTDATGQRERLSCPYATLAGALADAQSGDLIWMGPGIFQGSVVIPPDLANLSIQGAGRDATRLTPTNSAECIEWSSAAPMDSLTISDMSIDMGIVNQPAILIDGVPSGGASFGSTDGLRLYNINVFGMGSSVSVAIRCINSVEVHGYNGPDLHLDRVARGIVDGVYVSGMLTNVNSAAESVQPTDPIDRVRLTKTTCDVLISSGNAQTVAESTVNATTQVAGVHADSATDVCTGSLAFHGTAQAVQLTYNQTNDKQTRDDLFNLVGCVVHGELGIQRDVAGVGTGIVRVNAQNITLMTNQIGEVSVDDYVALDIRGGFFHQEALTNGGKAPPDQFWGTIDRDYHSFDGVNAEAWGGGTEVQIHPPLPQYAGYGLVIESESVGTIPAITTIKSGDKFGVSAPTVTGLVDITLVRTRLQFLPV